MTRRADASEIMVSDVVRRPAAGKSFLFSDRGVTALKGFDEPARVWEVRSSRGGQVAGGVGRGSERARLEVAPLP